MKKNEDSSKINTNTSNYKTERTNTNTTTNTNQTNIVKKETEIAQFSTKIHNKASERQRC